MRDAAYQSLLKSRRQQLHARIVQVLEGRSPDAAETEPELLAQHCAGAGQVEKAVGYWLKAGQLALRRSATVEAIAQLTAGMELLVGLVQAMVFMLLTAVFTLLICHHEEAGATGGHGSAHDETQHAAGATATS